MSIKSNAGGDMLPDHHGISSGIVSDGPGKSPALGEPVPVLFLNDHQLPPAEEYAPGEDPATLARLKAAGFVVQVGRGGLTGNLKE